MADKRRTKKQAAKAKPAKAKSVTAKPGKATPKPDPTQGAKADPDDVLLARLRAADPAADLPPAAPERVRRLLEDVMKNPVDQVSTPDSATAAPKAADPSAAASTAGPRVGSKGSPKDGPEPGSAGDGPSAAPSGPARSRWSRALPWLAGAAAAAMVAIAGFSLMAQRVEAPSQPPSVAAPEPSSTTVAAPAAAPGRCVPPSAEVLAGAELAVDATVTEVVGDQVTLMVNQWFAGTPTDELVVTAAPASLQELIGAPDLQQGQRYLLAANGGQLMVCGFSGPFDSERSTLYTTAFGG